MHVAKRKGTSLASRAGRPPLVPRASKTGGKAPSPAYRLYAIATVTCLSALFVLLWSRQPSYQVPISRQAAAKDACLPRPLVCAQNVPGSELNARTGSVDLLSEIWKSGIHCVGLSVTPLKDTLVAREVSRIKTVADSIRSSLSPQEQLIPLLPTHEQVLEWANSNGAIATEDFPTLDRALNWFYDVVKETGGIVHSETRPLQRWFGQSDKTSHLDPSLPMLLLTIEGDNVRTAHYSAAAAMVADLGLSHHVGVIVPEGAAHRDAFAGAIASASPEIYRGLSVTSDAGKYDAQRSRKLGSTLYDFLAPNADSPEAMFAAAHAPGTWKPAVAVGVNTEATFTAALQHHFPVVISTQALTFHPAVEARSAACRNTQLQSMHAHNNSNSVGGEAQTQQGRPDGVALAIEQQIATDASGDEAESAEAGGAGDHDLEQKAAAMLRIERAAEAAVAAGAVGISTGVAGEHGGATTTSTTTSSAAASIHSTSASSGGVGGSNTVDSMHATHEYATLDGEVSTGGSNSMHSEDTIIGTISEDVQQAQSDMHMHGAAGGTARSRVVRLPEDEQPQVEVEGGVVKNATHELVSADVQGGVDTALEAQPGTEAPVLRARRASDGSTPG